MKDAYYFPHDSNASSDPSILKLRLKFGWEGYGMYWAIIEALRDCPGYEMPLDSVDGLSLRYGIPNATLLTLFMACYDYQLLAHNDTKFWSNSLKRRMQSLEDVRKRLSDAGKVGAERRWGGHMHPNATPIAVKESKVKESKVKKSYSMSCKHDLMAPILYLNQKTKRNFDPKNKATQAFVMARYNEGRTLDDFKKVIDRKCAQWLTDEKMVNYLRPSTLFNRTKFENYLNEKETYADRPDYLRPSP